MDQPLTYRAPRDRARSNDYNLNTSEVRENFLLLKNLLYRADDGRHGIARTNHKIADATRRQHVCVFFWHHRV